MLSTVTVFAALAAGPTLGAIVDYNFVVSNVNTAPDGFQRSAVAVNGLNPGTLITVRA